MAETVTNAALPGAELVERGVEDLRSGRESAEALRTRIFPGIAFRGEDWDRRPWVIGTAFDVWQVVDAHRDFGSVEAMVAEGNLSERQILLALAYYGRFPEEIDEAIALQRRPLAQLRAEYPFIKVYSPGTE